MSLFYGEGREEAFIRLKKKIDKTSKDKSPSLEQSNIIGRYVDADIGLH